MASYEFLAHSYDDLMRDADYARRADFVEKLFLRTAKRRCARSSTLPAARAR
jgi:hypothetical protein